MSYHAARGQHERVRRLRAIARSLVSEGVSHREELQPAWGRSSSDTQSPAPWSRGVRHSRGPGWQISEAGTDVSDSVTLAP